MVEPIKATILYIEDDKGSQRLVKRVLENQGYTVFVAGEGLEGISIAHREQPNLILMDINLPTMDGQEITTRLRSLPNFSDIPIVAVTANISPGSRQQALAAGCTGFLTKPIDVATFPQQVESFLTGEMDSLPQAERNQHLEIYAQRLVHRLEEKIRELETANKQLRELDQMKSDFIILVSHELRTPLTLISGYAYLLKERTDRENEEHSQAVIDIANGLSMGVERLGQVVNEIISVSRIASGTLDLAFGPTRLSIVVKQIMIEIHALITSRHLTIELEEDLDALPMVEADGSQLRIAIQNVINNAIKFTPDGGYISIRTEIIDDTIDIIIKDTGIGIAPDQQRVIFDQFHVLGAIEHHSTSKSAFQGGGLGLGLPIAKGIIEGHNGRIWVESEGYDPNLTLGSTFHILLPIKQG